MLVVIFLLEIVSKNRYEEGEREKIKKKKKKVKKSICLKPQLPSLPGWSL